MDKSLIISIAALVVAGYVALFGGGETVIQRIPVGVPSETTTFTNPIVFDQTVDVSGIVSASAEGNKLGSANSTNYTYFGAGDGCAAVFFTASTTQTVQATSTAFCNS